MGAVKYTDREKVIYVIERCISQQVSDTCRDCSYYGIACMDKLLAEALALLKEQEQKWISVEDRLPEIRHAVLAYSPFHKHIWAVSMHEDGEWYYWIPSTEKYDPDWQGPITHWMPMPEIPDD